MVYNYLRNFLEPSDFHIDLYDKQIHIINYDKILTLGTNKIIIKSSSKKVILEGSNFSLNKLTNADKELLISGKLESLEIKYE